MKRAALVLGMVGALVVTGTSVSAVATPPDGAGRPPQGEAPGEIRLKSRTFTPAPGLERQAIDATADGGNDRVHFLLQFRQLPDAAARRAFAAQGTALVGAVTRGVYVAAAAPGDVGRAQGLQGFRWAGPLRADDKLDPALRHGPGGLAPRVRDGRVALTVQVHADVSVETAVRIALDHGGEVVGVVPSVPSVTAIFPGRSERALAEEDEVQYVAPLDAPLQDHNDGVVPAIGATPLSSSPYNLTGAGVTVMVYDSGLADSSHADFAGRIVQTDPDTGGSPPLSVRSHSTHVAGTALGSGANSDGTDSAGTANGGSANQWAGVAPGALLATYGSIGSGASTDVLYDDAGDLNADVTLAATSPNSIDLVTMSLGNNTGSNRLPCSQLGDYTNTSIALDQIVTGNVVGQEVIYVESAGNERSQTCTTGTGYGTISSPAPAKNTIVVGAVNSDDNSMTSFSSWGPVDDGRLRPDVVGPGCQTTGNGDGGVTSADFLDVIQPPATQPNGNLDPGEVQNAYSARCGTSMSTPAVAGVLALLIEQWRADEGAGTRPLPHTAKAMLIHTATDLGNPGPDYGFGYGLVNAQAAVDLVRADSAGNSLIHVDQVDQGDSDTWLFTSDGSGQPKITLAWSDPAATRLSTTQLVNDLDLVVTAPDGETHQPLVLSPSLPASNAVEGTDATNVVEMVLGDAEAGLWEVTVGGTAVPSGPQTYTLVTPADAQLDGPPVADAGGPYFAFEGATNLVLDAARSSDPNGQPLSYAWDLDNDGLFDDATGATPLFPATGQDGVVPVAVRVTDSGGATAEAAATVTVLNAAPVLAASSDTPRPEGTLVTVSGTVTDPGWLDVLTGTIDWGDGTGTSALVGTLENGRPDANLTFSATHRYADDDVYDITACGADDDLSICDTMAVDVTNVVPDVIRDAGQVTTIDEGETVALLAQFADPGWADTYASSIHWGTGLPDSTEPGALELTQQGPLEDRGVVTGSHSYGDDGTYTVTTSVEDDDNGEGSDAFALTVANVDPTAAIDLAGATVINGTSAFLAHAGEELSFAGQVTDPGSDDLAVSWDWDTATPATDETRPYPVNPPDLDGPNSPTLQPRSVDDSTQHTFGSACLYEIELASQDDDAGSGVDSADVLITGNALVNHTAGYWKQQMEDGSAQIDAATIGCYLDIVGFASSVFDEVRGASTRAAARQVLTPGGNDARRKLELQLLALWLNFADGGTDYNEPVDTNGDRTPDTALSAVLTHAENIRLSVVSTRAQLLDQATILERVNRRDG